MSSINTTSTMDVSSAQSSYQTDSTIPSTFPHPTTVEDYLPQNISLVNNLNSTDVFNGTSDGATEIILNTLVNEFLELTEDQLNVALNHFEDVNHTQHGDGMGWNTSVVSDTTVINHTTTAMETSVAMETTQIPTLATIKELDKFSNQDIWFIITGAVFLAVIFLMIINCLLKYGPAIAKLLGYGTRKVTPPVEERRVRRDQALLTRDDSSGALAASNQQHHTQTHLLSAGLMNGGIGKHSSGRQHGYRNSNNHNNNHIPNNSARHTPSRDGNSPV